MSSDLACLMLFEKSGIQIFGQWGTPFVISGWRSSC